MKRIMIQENWDESVQTNVVNLLQKLIPHGVWQHIFFCEFDGPRSSRKIVVTVMGED